MLSLLRRLSVEWPPQLIELFQSAKTLSGGAISLADCFKLEYWNICRFYVRVRPAASFLLATSSPELTRVPSRLQFFLLPSFCLLAPLVMVAIASIFLIVCGKADSLKSIEIFQMNPRTIYRNSVLVLSYVAWPAVARQAFEVMHCTTINGRRYLSADLRVSCDDNTY